MATPSASILRNSDPLPSRLDRDLAGISKHHHSVKSLIQAIDDMYKLAGDQTIVSDLRPESDVLQPDFCATLLLTHPAEIVILAPSHGCVGAELQICHAAM